MTRPPRPRSGSASRALRGQKRGNDAQAAERAFAKAWARADIKLSSTALL